MKFENFVKNKKVRVGNKDISLARSLKEMAAIDLKFLDRQKIDNISARKVMCGYYDVLRSFLEAMAAIDGYKVYSHEAFTFYLKEKGEDVIAIKFDRYRKIRNKINYYGEDITIAEVKEYKEDILKLARVLDKKLNEMIG